MKKRSLKKLMLNKSLVSEIQEKQITGKGTLDCNTNTSYRCPPSFITRCPASHCYCH
jgi:hypothetical protein